MWARLYFQILIFYNFHLIYSQIKEHVSSINTLRYYFFFYLIYFLIYSLISKRSKKKYLQGLPKLSYTMESSIQITTSQAIIKYRPEW